MNRELYNAINRGQKLLDERGPRDWRNTIRQALATDSNFNPVLWLSGAYSADDYYKTAERLGLLTPHEITILKRGAGPRLLSDTYGSRLIEHAFWPYYNDTPNSPWTHEQLREAWTKLLDHPPTKLPDKVELTE